MYKDQTFHGESMNSVRVIGNYVCKNAPVKDGGITYIAYDFPSKI